jgi:single-stranded DNA-binding protein
MVGVDGRLTRRSYVNKEGKETYVTEIVIDSINSLAKSTKTLNSSETAVDKIYNKTIASEGEVGSDEIDDLTNLLIDKGGNN